LIGRRRRAASGYLKRGPLEPCTPLRALDKWLWWNGGGKDSHAYVDPDPWRVLRELSLERE